MATKRTRKQAITAKNPTDQARAAWLAGLGAVSIVQKRGGELLGTLTSEGAEFQMRAQKLAQAFRADARKQVKSALAPVKANAKNAVQKFGAAVQQGIATVLAKLGIPSKADIEELTTRVTALSRQLKTR
jgi:poly(hydroxyalkanoate) granule-associated protein